MPSPSSDFLDLDALVADAEALAAKAKSSKTKAAASGLVWREERTYPQFVATHLTLVRNMGKCSQCDSQHPLELELWIEYTAHNASKRTRVTKVEELSEIRELIRLTRDEVTPVPFCANCATALFYKDLSDDQPYPAA